MSKFKVGQKCFSILEGECEIIDDSFRGNYTICTVDRSYTKDGRNLEVHAHPTLFESIDHCIAYFQKVKEDMSGVKFKDMVEGKQYVNGSGWKYEKREGLLWCVDDNEYSGFGMDEVSLMRFKEVKE